MFKPLPKSALAAFGCFLCSTTWAMDSNTTTTQRESAVMDAKAGHLSEAINRLVQLHAQSPEDKRVIADLMVLLRLAGRNREIEILTQNLVPSSQADTPLPDYALMTWASALRDVQQFGKAQQILAVSKDRLSMKAQVLYAVVSAEAGQSEVATAALPVVDAQLDASDLAQMAYVCRLAKQPSRALAFSIQARQKDPNQAQAIQESVYALSSLNATAAAYTLATAHPALFSVEMIRRLRTDNTVIKLHDAMQERTRLDDQHEFTTRNQSLDAALTEIETNLKDFPRDSNQYRRNEFDRVYALRLLHRMPEAIQAYRQIDGDETQFPPYARRAVADAYLAQQQPKVAVSIYSDLLKSQNDAPLYLSLYHALIEAEDYKRAAEVLNTVNKVTPYVTAPEVVGGAPMANWERLDVDQAVAIDAAYRNDLAKAERQYADLVQRAPSNVGIIDDYATILRWRGWPQAAERVTARAVAMKPDEPLTRMNVANNARDLEQTVRWGESITLLHSQFPENPDVQQSYVAWQNRARPSISSELVVGKSTGADNEAINIQGSRDLDWVTRINTPWVLQDWRGFAQLDNRWSNINSETVRDNRIGAGVEWGSQRRNGWLMLSQQYAGDGTGNHAGVSGGWSQWLNDHWQYALNASSDSADTPLRAMAAGLSAWDASGKVTWRQSESRSAYLGLGVMDISDGNQRQMVSLGGSQRLFGGDHYVTTGGIDLYNEHNSQAGGVYYNPSQLFSAALRLQHDWVTWRDYDRSLTQNFQIATGISHEAGYRSAATIDLTYQHTWQLSREWKLHYGVLWGSHTYSGDREGRLAALLGFEGVF
ncbi:poly-beta-1,6 N-acetyl-D-glucosamine export porin PgaA [Aquirhabdus sp.]|uniref:poly-beta-1,6 N-acetyl-D-glucosamine export porin PgaA n=1 Tax=Aquirhabdus sp. TaxID=2824160 RepID=UPI00396C8D0F